MFEVITCSSSHFPPPKKRIKEKNRDKASVKKFNNWWTSVNSIILAIEISQCKRLEKYSTSQWGFLSIQFIHLFNNYH
jgi:hypothetical protein